MDFAARNMEFILASYAVTVVVLLALTITITLRTRNQDRRLAQLDHARAEQAGSKAKESPQ